MTRSSRPVSASGEVSSAPTLRRRACHAASARRPGASCRSPRDAATPRTRHVPCKRRLSARMRPFSSALNRRRCRRSFCGAATTSVPSIFRFGTALRLSHPSGFRTLNSRGPVSQIMLTRGAREAANSLAVSPLRRQSRTCRRHSSRVRFAIPQGIQPIRDHLVENFFQRIKRYRRIATRFEKRAENFQSMLCLAGALTSEDAPYCSPTAICPQRAPYGIVCGAVLELRS